MPRGVTLLLLTLLSLTVLTACIQAARPPSSSLPEEPFPTLPPIPSPIPTPTPAPLLSPLCGKTVADPALLTLRPVAVKIDNASPARPQAGLSEACLVYEHLTEWGITRFTAIYHTESVEPLGPVRSARLVDLDLGEEYGALFSHVGASEPIMRRIRNSSLLDLDQFFNSKAYYRTTTRQAPYNMYTSVAALRQIAAEKGWEEPPSLEGFSFSERTPQGGAPATYVAIGYPNPSFVEYRYNAERAAYGRFLQGKPHIDANGEKQIEVKNVVVQYVVSWPTEIIEDVGGGRSLQFERLGQGKAEIFRDGQQFSARWVRKAPKEMTRFLDEWNRPIPFAPGPVWISLVTEGTEIVVRAEEGQQAVNAASQ